jgi:hypothetical protein
MAEAGSGRMHDAAMWSLRAEEYRAVAASMRSGALHDVFAGMAANCQRLAENAAFMQQPLTRASCLARAEACAAFADALQTAPARTAVLELVHRWRRLAERFPEMASLPQAAE